MAKYKIGDKVKIREDLKGGCRYNGIHFATYMEIYKGKTATITEVTNVGDYSIDLDKGDWYWSDDMFENKISTEKQLNDKISELEKQIAELKEQKEQLNKKDYKMPVGEIWKPKEYKKYYYIDCAFSDNTYGNDIDIFTNKFDELDNRLIESGNCYPTKEKAEFEAQREKYTRLFRQYVEQHSEPLDWNNRKQSKYYVYCCHCDACMGETITIANVYDAQFSFTIYASNAQVLQEAIDFVGEENVKKYILEIGE